MTGKQMNEWARIYATANVELNKIERMDEFSGTIYSLINSWSKKHKKNPLDVIEMLYADALEVEKNMCKMK